MSRVQKRVSNFVNFKVQKVQKLELFDLTDNGICSSDARGLICHIPHLCAIFQTNNVGLGPCVGPFVRLKGVALMTLLAVLEILARTDCK